MLKWLALAIAILGALVGVVAIVYYAVPAHSLPLIFGRSVCPAHHEVCLNSYHLRRGEVAAIGSVLLFVFAGLVYVFGRHLEIEGAAAVADPVAS